MSVTAVYRLCAVSIGETTIGQIVEQELSQEIQEFLARDSAAPYNRAAGVGLLDARIRFTTEAVKAALTAVGLTGTAISSTAKVVAYFASYTAGGVIAAKGCLTLTAEAGLCLWRSLEAAEGQPARVAIEIIALSADGSTHPLAEASGVDTPTIETGELWTIGGASGVQSISLDTGIAEVLARGDGDAFNTFAAIDLIAPTITVRQTDAGAVDPADAEVVATLREVAHGGYRGDGSLTFTAAKGLTTLRRLGGSPALSELRTACAWDGTDAPLAVGGLT